MLLTVSLLCIVTFIAGLIDSIAGGGGLLGCPALLIAGVSPQQALGTNKFTGAIGTGAAMLNFARKGLILWKLAFIGIPCALLGSAAGSRLHPRLRSPDCRENPDCPAPRSGHDNPDPPALQVVQGQFHLKRRLPADPAHLFQRRFLRRLFRTRRGKFLHHRLQRLSAHESHSGFRADQSLQPLLQPRVAVRLPVSRRRAFSLRHPHDRGRRARQPHRRQLAIRTGPTIVRRFLLLSLVILFVSLIWKYYFAG